MTSQLEESVLSLLKKNARLSAGELASLTNSTSDKIEKTVKKLEKNKTILQYTTIVDDEKLPSSTSLIRALIEVRVRSEKKSGFNRVAKQIFQHNNVIDHFLISGSYDFLIIVEGTDIQNISSFVSNKLAPLEGVKSTTTHFILKKYKENGVIIGDD
ncbi:MAG: DNA-binding Lrp family transcriptional regulator, partial [Candidatus Marinamargulisbacteria bacterium]